MKNKRTADYFCVRGVFQSSKPYLPFRKGQQHHSSPFLSFLSVAQSDQCPKTRWSYEEFSIYLGIKFKLTSDSKSGAKERWLWISSELNGVLYWSLQCNISGTQWTAILMKQSKFNELPNSLGPFRKLLSAWF